MYQICREMTDLFENTSLLIWIPPNQTSEIISELYAKDFLILEEEFKRGI